FGVPPVWQPGGVGGGGPVTVSENVPVAVAPAASVTVTVNVDVPVAVGAPSSSPDGRSVRPAGGRPDQGDGAVPPLARQLALKKLLTNTFLPAPMSHTPPAQVKNWVLIASGAGVPVPVPVIGTVCGLFAALSVKVRVAVRVPVVVGEKVTEVRQLWPGASVRPGHPSLTMVKSSALPLSCTPLTNRFAVPVLVAVIVCAALVVPVACGANVSEAGESESAGADPPAPPPPPPPPWSASAGARTAKAPATSSGTVIHSRNRRSRIVWTSIPSRPG